MLLLLLFKRYLAKNKAGNFIIGWWIRFLVRRPGSSFIFDYEPDVLTSTLIRRLNHRTVPWKQPQQGKGDWQHRPSSTSHKLSGVAARSSTWCSYCRVTDETATIFQGTISLQPNTSTPLLITHVVIVLFTFFILFDSHVSRALSQRMQMEMPCVNCPCHSDIIFGCGMTWKHGWLSREWSKPPL